MPHPQAAGDETPHPQAGGDGTPHPQAAGDPADKFTYERLPPFIPPQKDDPPLSPRKRGETETLWGNPASTRIRHLSTIRKSRDYYLILLR